MYKNHYFMDWMDRRLYHVPELYLKTFKQDCEDLGIQTIETVDHDSSLYPGHVFITEDHHLKKYGKSSKRYD